MAAVAVAHAITQNLTLSPGIKWPNDILVNNKKIAGILLETKSSPTQLLYAVLGIGVNVNHTSDDLPSDLPLGASSLRMETGEPVEREGLVCEMFAELEKLYEEIRLGGLDSVLEEWRKLSITLGQGVRVHQGERVIEGTAMDVNEEGALMVKEGDGSLTVVHAGDVEHLRAIQ
jgi:BirA family biotin operon repressor/biotin-[acetyl-CoA-carboxylase] ligase